MITVYKFDLSYKYSISDIFTAELDENDDFTKRLISNDANITIGYWQDVTFYMSTSLRSLDCFRKGMLEMFSFATKTGPYEIPYEEKVKGITEPAKFYTKEFDKIANGETVDETPL